MALLLPVLIFIEYRRHNPEATILLLPAALALGSYNVGTLLNVLTYMHFNVSAASNMLLFHIGFLPVPIYSVFLSCFWLSIGLIILLRASRANQQQARLASELEAARGVQKLLLADEAVETPGFTVESVYLPAAEVGGDFFLMHPGSDGSLLVVVGDVSGKGVPAALAVSTVVGALRGSQLRSPAAVLAHLNRVLHRRISGFATCCVLHLPALATGTGTFTIANAGHIPPYRNGKALPIAGDLPLAILPEVAYEEEQISFAAGDRFTIISDGVLEATNPLLEMFGFERTEAISVQSAATIAETARAFGHQDDITVVTLVVEAIGSLRA
jgi:serine phosphatase RsbU (regulator of sigma subunit)